MSKFLIVILFSFQLGLISAYEIFGDCPKIEAIPNFNIKNYLGFWYEIKRLPARFEEGRKCNQAEYTLIDDSSIRVNNSAFNM